MSSPKVSIIMLSYNHADYVGMAIESVLKQTFQDWELVLVDDASPDSSWEIISQYDDPRIRSTRFDKNRGAAAAYETARAQCGGEYLGHIDSDDAWESSKLEKQCVFLDDNCEVDICCSFVSEIDLGGSPFHGDYSDWFNAECDLSDGASWVWQNRVCHSSILMRRRLHDQIGAINGDLIHTPDWDLWVRCLLAGGRIAQIREPLTLYRSHSSNITKKNPGRSFREYAYISASALHPWFFDTKRPDLVHKNVHAFIDSSQFDQLLREERQALLGLIMNRSAETRAFCDLYQSGGLIAENGAISVETSLLESIARRCNYSFRKDRAWLEVVPSKGAKRLFSEVQRVEFGSGSLETAVFRFPRGAGPKRLLLTVCPGAAIIRIDAIRVFPLTGESREPHTENLQNIKVRGADIRELPCESGFRMAVVGSDALFLLPRIPDSLAEQPIVVEIDVILNEPIEGLGNIFVSLPEKPKNRLLSLFGPGS